MIGHLHIVTAIECIEGTPMIITADDNGTIKTWDIRSFQCCQTIELSRKTLITKLLNMDNIGKVSFIGCRVNFLKFDTYEMDKSNERKTAFPIKAEFNPNFNELAICTRSDIRFVNIHDGQCKKIYINLIDPEETDEITVFRLIQKNHKFILGDHKGNVRIYSYNTGDLVRKLDSHLSEVAEIKVDNFNKLFVTGGLDSQIKIQRVCETQENKHEPQEPSRKKKNTQKQIQDLSLKSPYEVIKHVKEMNHKDKPHKSLKNAQNDKKEIEFDEYEGCEVLRTIENVHFKKEILLLELSVYHNLIVTASYQSELYIYDFEYGKTVAFMN